MLCGSLLDICHGTEDEPTWVAVVNTCGFIGDAKEESINMILRLAQRKQQGKLKQLFVMGCLSERYLKELQIEIPEVDKFYGKFNYNELLTDLGKQFHPDFGLERVTRYSTHLQENGIQMLSQQSTAL